MYFINMVYTVCNNMVYIYTYQWFTNDVYITVYMIYGIWVSHGFFTYAVYIHGLDTLEEMV